MNDERHQVLDLVQFCVQCFYTHFIFCGDKFMAVPNISV